MGRKITLVLLSAFCITAAAGAGNKFAVSGSLDVSTAYMWRGSRECGAHVSPCLTLQWGGLALQTYGFVSFDGTYKEIDWDLSYSVGDFTFHLADYYARLSSWTSPENYFSFRKGATNHIQEAIICYEPSRLPFAVRWFTFLHGDWIPEADGSLGKPSFASYMEAEVFHEFTPGNNRLSLLCGASVFKGSFTGYTKNFAVINLELKYSYILSLNSVQIPLQVFYTLNPYSGKTFLNAGAGIRF